MSGPNYFRVPALNSCEMYPRRRPTEFYRTLNPRASIQSLLAEHPRDVLNARYIQEAFPQPHFPRIRPPRTSAMASMRNNYFS